MRWLALGLVGFLGCGFHGGFDGTQYRCGADLRCPVGFACVAGTCVAGAPDAAPDADPAAPDAAAATTPCGSMNLLVDDFAAAQAGPLWEPFAEAPLTIAQTGGLVQITAPAGASTTAAAGYRSRFAYDLTGAQLAATVDQVGGRTTILEVRDAAGARAQLTVEGGMIGAAVYGVAGGGARAAVPYEAATHRVWRIREDRGELYWDTSPNAATWTTLWHEPLPFAVAHTYGFVAVNGQAAAPGAARFLDVNLAAPAAPGFCSGATLVDDFTALDARWSTWADPGASVDTSGGKLVLSSASGSENYAGIDSEHLYDLTAGAVYLDATDVAGGTSFVSYFQALAPGDGGTRIEIDRDEDTLQFQQWVNGTAVTDFQFPYATSDRYWRLRVDGGQVRLGTSADGATWGEHTNATAAFDASAVHIVVGAGHYATGGASVQAAFGGINTP